MTTTNPAAGIPDPVNPDRWLVLPWPADAGFSTVVRHFLRAYGWPLFGDKSTARQLAYFEGYQAALLAASTDDLRDSLAWKWRDELLDCVADCVADFRAQVADRPVADENIQRLPVVSTAEVWDCAS